MIGVRTVLVTGASGFLGQFVCDDLRGRGLDVITTHRGGSVANANDRPRIYWDLEDPATLRVQDLNGIDAVVHLAARVHVMGHEALDDGYFHGPNVHATKHIAEIAAAAGASRFVYMSSIKVNGEATTVAPFTPDDRPAPEDAYGRSKLLAERALHEIAARTGLQAVVIRPPLVFGPGVGGNFVRMLRWVARGWPLPLGGVKNLRSYLSAWNLADLVGTALLHPGAAGRTLLVADGPAVSTADLLRRLARACGRKPLLFDVPEQVMYVAAQLTGRTQDIARLCGSLVVDDSATRAALGWNPPVPFDDGILRTAHWYMESAKHAKR
jgi:UDP-glucose 4-epimerase